MDAGEVYRTTRKVKVYPYIRKMYARKRLRQLQGKPCVHIPKDLCEKIELKFSGKENKPFLTEKIKAYLRRNGYK
jgi:hypothetical protein